jgi:dipeptidase E
MGKYEIDDDFVINDTLKPHVNDNFRVTSYPGAPLHHDPSGRAVYPTLLTTGSGNAIHLPFLFDKLISLTGKPKPNVVYIGTPFFDREDKYESGTESFRRLGCRLKRLMVAKECTTPSFDEMRRIVLEWPDLIIISGGNSLFAMLRWQSIGLDLLLREAAGQGKVLSGGSAGCGCYFDT